MCKVALNSLMKSDPDRTKLDCSEPDHAELNQGLPHEIVRSLLFCDILQRRTVISH